MGNSGSSPSPPPPPPEAPKPAADGGNCARYSLSGDTFAKATTMNDIYQVLKDTQPTKIQKISGLTFSSDTKLNLVPSLPFRMKLDGKDFTVDRMTIYHPSPVRINNRQHDAVLSLNDPSLTGADGKYPEVIVLIPLEGVSIGGGKSTAFFSRIVSYIPGIVQPNAAGEYNDINVPSGSGFVMTDILNTPDSGTDNLDEIQNGYYTWNGTMTDSDIAPYMKSMNRWANTINMGWRQKTKPPRYIIMEDAAKINSMDLQTIRMLPVTPVEKAIHGISDKVMHVKNKGRSKAALAECPNANKSWWSRQERFTVGGKCDPLANMDQTANAITTETITNVLIGMVSFIAVFVGVYYALKWGTTPASDLFKNIGEKIGKAFGGKAGAAAITRGIASRALIPAKTEPTITRGTASRALVPAKADLTAANAEADAEAEQRLEERKAEAEAKEAADKQKADELALKADAERKKLEARARDEVEIQRENETRRRRNVSDTRNKTRRNITSSEEKQGKATGDQIERKTKFEREQKAKLDRIDAMMQKAEELKARATDTKKEIVADETKKYAKSITQNELDAARRTSADARKKFMKTQGGRRRTTYKH